MALKKNSPNSDIDSLKARFSQRQQSAQPAAQAPQGVVQQQGAQQSAQPQQAVPPTQAAVQQPPQAVQAAVQAQQIQKTQQSQAAAQPSTVPPTPVAGRSPLEALWDKNQQQAPGQQVNVVELEGDHNQLVSQGVVEASAPTPAAQAAQQMAVDAVQAQSADTSASAGQETGAESSLNQDSLVEESLMDLKDKYDDAKLNSIIIEQVKELIEIDNNLNNKIEDIRSDLRKEVEERQKLAKMNEERYDELKELEKSIEKFIALYEVVTNQFNPFVKQDDPQGSARFNQLVQGADQQVESQQHADTSVHFVTGKGQKIKNLAELMSFVAALSDKDFSSHVGPYKNDFAMWIHHGLHMPKLAEVVSKQDNKQDILKILVDYKKYQ